MADHVERIYDDSYFLGGGAGYDDYFAEADLLTARARWYARRLRPFCSPGTVLDVGAAAGFLLHGFVQEGWAGLGIEPNARMATYAHTTLGLAVTQATLEGMPECGPFGLISMIQVLIHFVDPLKALESAARVTKPGGLWLVETWNRDSWTARWFGTPWHAYSPPSVLHWFSPAGLDALVGRFGFHLVARGRPSKWISGGHAKSLLRYHLQSSWVGRLASHVLDVIPDRLCIPYPAEDLFWALFQRAR
jgi:SAM-dependent methyltransferase